MVEEDPVEQLDLHEAPLRDQHDMKAMRKNPEEDGANT